ncbi:MAG: hypothetical protein MK085_02525 [Phycisphaerales bacterium]|nr:hypothetical protein [Phycisphaerales bacterium]
MKCDRAMTMMLGVNALLTAGLLWTNFLGVGPVGSVAEAAPQYRSTRVVSPPGSSELTGAAGSSTRQRKQMIERLDALLLAIEGLERTLKSGGIEVRVDNLEDIDLGIDYDRLVKVLRKTQE